MEEAAVEENVNVSKCVGVVLFHYSTSNCLLQDVNICGSASKAGSFEFNTTTNNNNNCEEIQEMGMMVQLLYKLLR